MVSPNNHLEQIVYSRGKSYPEKKGKEKLHQMEFLLGNSGAEMVGGSSGTAGQSGSSFEEQRTIVV